MFGLFLLLTSGATIYFLFNTGQLTREKVKLVNTADAVAYSAGLLEARAMNFDAYGNRALVANEVAIAQMVSMASWARYVETVAPGVPAHYPGCQRLIPGLPATYALCYGMQTLGDEVRQAASVIPSAARDVEVASEAAKAAIKASQSVLHAAGNALLLNARRDLMDRVAAANYRNDGSVRVDLVPLDDNLNGFVRQYRRDGRDGDERARMGELVKLAAYRDDFVRDRRWVMRVAAPLDGSRDDWSILPTCYDHRPPFAYIDHVRRRGGTELLGYDEWKAMDTLSHHVQVSVHHFLRPSTCEQSENPLGYGSQTAIREQEPPAGNDGGESGASDAGSQAPEGSYGDSIGTNPDASALAQDPSAKWAYSGIPDFYDLSADALAQADPTLRFAIRITRDKAETRTTETASPVRAGGRLAIYDGDEAVDTLSGRRAMAAVSGAEVFFDRPAPRDDGKKELASLFNPFWQVRLAAPSAAVRGAAAALQGALPIPEQP